MKILQKFIVVTFLPLLLLGCLPSFSLQQSLKVTPTISSDGKLLVVLLNAQTKNATLKMKWLDKVGPWQDVPAPKNTNSIRFGLTGYKLLITHDRPGIQGASQLSRWDVSQPLNTMEILYMGFGVSDPVEIKPDKVLVSMCPQKPGEVDHNGKAILLPCQTYTPSGTWEGTGFMAAIIENGKAEIIENSRGLSEGLTSVTDDGFFWLEDTYFTKKKGGNIDQRVLASYAFPGGNAPQLDTSKFNGLTGGIVCDSKLIRCLYHYIAEESKNKDYLFKMKVINGNNECDLAEPQGRQEQFHFTPDGNFAVIVASESFEAEKYIVVLGFKSGQCEPISTKNISLREI